LEFNETVKTKRKGKEYQFFFLPSEIDRFKEEQSGEVVHTLFGSEEK